MCLSSSRTVYAATITNKAAVGRNAAPGVKALNGAHNQGPRPGHQAELWRSLPGRSLVLVCATCSLQKNAGFQVLLREKGDLSEVIIKKLGHFRCGDYRLPDSVAYTINGHPVAVATGDLGEQQQVAVHQTSGRPSGGVGPTAAFSRESGEQEAQAQGGSVIDRVQF